MYFNLLCLSGATTLYAGETAMVPVMLNNFSLIYSADGIITLPEGMEVKKNTDGKIDIILNEERASKEDGFSVSATLLPDGSVKFHVASEFGRDFSGFEGAVMFVPVVVGKELEGDYEIQLTEVKMRGAEGHEINCQNSAMTITVERYMPGDVDRDWQNAENDIALTIKAYLGERPTEFCFPAADINANEIIDPADVTSVTKLYFGEECAETQTIEADDIAYLADVVASPWGESSIEFGMDLKRDVYTSLGGIITLHKGFTFKKDSNGKTMVTKNDDVLKSHNIYTYLLSDSQMKFLIYSNNLSLIEAGKSTMMSVKVLPDEGMEPDEYIYSLTALQLSDYDGRLYEANDAEGTLTIPCDEPSTFALIDGEPYRNDKDYEGVDVTYTRNFNNTNWQPLYLPFNLSCEEWADKAKVAYVHNVHQYDDDDDGEVDRTIIEFLSKKKGEIEPNKPYVIKPLQTGEMTLTGTNKTLVATPESDGYADCRSTTTEYTIYGTYQGRTDLYEMGYYAMAGGTFKLPSSASVTLSPFRTYMKIESRTGAGAMKKLPRVGIMVDGVIEGDATSIFGLEEDAEDDAPAYNLQGVRVGNGYKGIVVKNGKKVVRR